MNERELLLRAICENPDDDTLRLVFADWLQENDDEARAEFIRAQIELSQHTPHTIPWFECSTRARELSAIHESRWRIEVPSDPALDWREFRRGFLEKLRVFDFDAFEALAGQIFAATPLLEVHIGGPWRLSALSKLPHLNRLSVIRGYGVDCTAEDAAQVIMALAQNRLTQFDLLSGVIDEEARHLLVRHFGDVIRFPVEVEVE